MNFDIGSFLTTLAGAFVGALGAYFFNLKHCKDNEKRQEKAKLLKLLYDLNILIKIYVYFHKNIEALINNVKSKKIKYLTPLSIEDCNIDIKDYGFITTIYPRFYEILTYINHDINYLYKESELCLDNFEIINEKDYINNLNNLKRFTRKLLAKLYISLLNANEILIKNYGCDNLVKDEVINSCVRVKKVLDKVLSSYEKILQKSNKNNKVEFEIIEGDYEYLK